MKRIALLLAIMCAAVSLAARSIDYVYLNNGNVVKGYIESERPNVSLTIKSVDGNVYTYSMTEIRKISRKAPDVPAVGNDANLTRVRDMESGFWFALEAGAGSSARLHHTNRLYGELDFTFGYRVNQYARLGIGAGYRYYFNQVPGFRASDVSWSIPLFFNIRGNLLGQAYRSIAPYYSLDLGGAFKDGLMVRPAVGLRFGSQRSSFLVSVNYTAQQIPEFSDSNERNRKVRSFVGLKLGYEF